MRKRKSKGPLYDSNGRWVEERGQIKGAIRRTFRLSPQMDEVVKAARVELPPKTLKDGTIGKKPQVRYTCACCKQLFSQKDVQVDHIEPVVPLWKPETEMTYDEIVRGVFCSVKNLQLLCSTPLKRNNGFPSCHKLKTDEENFIRDNLKLVKNLKDHTGEEIDTMIERFKVKYKVYVEEKNEKQRAKLERKRQRELKFK